MCLVADTVNETLWRFGIILSLSLQLLVQEELMTERITLTIDENVLEKIRTVAKARANHFPKLFLKHSEFT